MHSKKLEFQPVIILGAGRSGTNALRDLLSKFPETTTWPCDEINPIWRHGNVDWPNDEIPATRAVEKIRKFIRRAFVAQWRRGDKCTYVIEKTCANTLRVDFVDSVFPEALYISIVRDGNDVVRSAMKRWRGEMELPKLQYFLAKARFIPISDLFNVGYMFIRARINKLRGEKRLTVWGPRFEGVEIIADSPLEEVCAAQWAACVEKAQESLSKIDPKRVFNVRYEDLVADPVSVTRAISGFLKMQLDEDAIVKSADVIFRPSPVAAGVPSNNDSGAGLSNEAQLILKPMRYKLNYLTP